MTQPSTLQKTKSTQAMQQFTPHYPKYHNSPFRLECCCGTTYRTDCLDSRALVRLIEWVNEHVACTEVGAA